MNTTDTAATTAQAVTALSTPARPSKQQRRMARPAPTSEVVPPCAATSPNSQPAPVSATGTKTSAVIALLEREEGATLTELIAATDWLPHTTRAALTGPRKKGHAIERSKRGEETCYRIIRPA